MNIESVILVSTFDHPTTTCVTMLNENHKLLRMKHGCDLSYYNMRAKYLIVVTM